MSDVSITVVGHVGQDPTLFTAESGTRWTSIRVASTRRVRNPQTGEWGDGPTMWFTVRQFGDRALNLIESVRKGTPVVVTGRLALEEYEQRKEERRPGGETVEVVTPRSAQVIENATVAVDLSRGVVRYTRSVSSSAVPGSGTGLGAGLGSDVVGSRDDGAEDLAAEDGDGEGVGTGDVARTLDDEERVEATVRELVGV
jgi:single-strand DNA-binding protein